MPARVLQRLTGLPEHPGTQPLPVNWAMHFGQAALLGVFPSIMAQSGLRGPVASAKFTVVRLTNDQILENATGVAAPPATWPRAELVVDVLLKAVYGFVTGAVADALAVRNGPGPGERHAARRHGSVPTPGRFPGRTATAGDPGRQRMSTPAIEPTTAAQATSAQAPAAWRRSRAIRSSA
ncbi:hypothetical protein ACF08O_38360 [Streptomyces paradoxus]|uniref:hypothetical protein n=1 Tax=Streptomyces paradoxus TaxID=66375 RepID=UPI0036F66F0B